MTARERAKADRVKLSTGSPKGERAPMNRCTIERGRIPPPKTTGARARLPHLPPTLMLRAEMPGPAAVAEPLRPGRLGEYPAGARQRVPGTAGASYEARPLGQSPTIYRRHKAWGGAVPFVASCDKTATPRWACARVIKTLSCRRFSPAKISSLNGGRE